MDLRYADGKPPKRPRDWISIALIAALTLLIVLVMLCVQGCAVVGADYVSADRMTYDVLAPLARDRWIPADTCLTSSEKDALGLLLQSWSFRIRAAEDEQ